MRRRVVITGMGAVTPLGNSVISFWERLIQGECGIAPITRFDASPYRNSLAGEVKGIEARGMTRSSAFALRAVEEAIGDAGLEEFSRVGIVLGTNFGGMDSALEYFRGEACPSSLRNYLFATPVDLAVQRYHIGGFSSCISLSCASGASSVGMAYDLIALGQAEVMLAGGYDELSELSYAGLSAMRAITPEILRPFDKNRKGTIFSEGSAVVVLEELEHALARGAKIYAEFLGHFMNNDAFHMTAPDKTGKGIKEVMERALQDAGLEPSEIDFINAHGTGTEYNDRIETSAIKELFDHHAYEIPVVSIKSSVGHMMGSAGTIEVISTVKSIQTGIVPPTVNLEEPDPECDLNYVRGEAGRFSISRALSNSYGIGGCNSAVVLGGYQR